MRRLLAAIVLLLPLSCGTETGDLTTQVLNDARALNPFRREEKQDVRAQLTRAALDQIQVPLILIEFPERSATTVAERIGLNGPFGTWRTLDNLNFTLRDGLLVGTRGLGENLAVVDVEDVQQALLGRGQPPGQPIVRVHRYIDGERQIQAMSFVCSYQNDGDAPVVIVERQYRTRLVVEQCSSSTEVFENHYWIDADRFVWKSRQWIGPITGYLVVERLTL